MLKAETRLSSRAGASLLEVIGATVCASILLVPTANLLGGAVRWSARMESHNELIVLADSLMDETRVQIAREFDASSARGDCTRFGFPAMRYESIWSDTVSNDGIPGRWMHIGLKVWVDQNSNAQFDSGEPMHEIHSGVAKR